MCVYRSTTETLSRKVVFTSRCLLNFLPGKKTAMTANMEILPSLPSLPLSAKWAFSTSISTALTGDALKSSLARKKRGRAPFDLGDHRRNDPEHWESDSRMENRSGYFLFESGGGEMIRCLFVRHDEGADRHLNWWCGCCFCCCFTHVMHLYDLKPSSPPFKLSTLLKPYAVFGPDLD